MMTQGMTTEAMTAAVMKANKTNRQFSSEQDNFLAGILPARGQYSISKRLPFAARSSSG
jgi:hypothetical protein